MQPYDIVILILLGVVTLLGFWKGMAWQVASLASIFVSAGIAVHGSRPIAHWFGEHEPWNRFLAMLVLYLVTALTIWIAFRLISGIINRVRLKEFDRQIGAMFGLAKGILWALLLTFFLVTLTVSGREMVLQSRAGRVLCSTIQKAKPILPDEITNKLSTYLDDFDQKLEGEDPSGKNPSQAPSETPPPKPTETEKENDKINRLLEPFLDLATERFLESQKKNQAASNESNGAQP